MSPLVKTRLVYWPPFLLFTCLIRHYDPPHTPLNTLIVMASVAAWAILVLAVWRTQLDRAARPEGKTAKKPRGWAAYPGTEVP